MTTESVPTMATGAITIVQPHPDATHSGGGDGSGGWGAAAIHAQQPARRRRGVLMQLGSALVSQSGATAASAAIGVVGAPVVVAVRQVVAAAILLPLVRPPLHRLHRRHLLLALLLGVTTVVMNLGLYTAIGRLGLALAVTLEFLGPLGVALAGARRVKDVAAAVLAVAGVVVLVHPGASTDWFGIGAAVLAAAAWAGYILLNRAVGSRLPGLQGAAVSASVGAGVAVPALVVFAVAGMLHPEGVLLAVLAGVLCSVVPMTADLFALRRIPANLFGVLASINPVAAAVAAAVFLREIPTLVEVGGIALIVTANVLATLERRPRRPRSPRRRVRAASPTGG